MDTNIQEKKPKTQLPHQPLKSNHVLKMINKDFKQKQEIALCRN